MFSKFCPRFIGFEFQEHELRAISDEFKLTRNVASSSHGAFEKQFPHFSYNTEILKVKVTRGQENFILNRKKKITKIKQKIESNKMV